MAFTGDVKNVVLPSPKNLPTIGGLFRGPLTVVVPTTLTTPVVALKQLGFIAEDGIDWDKSSPTTDINAWGSDLVASPQDTYTSGMTVTLYEYLNPEVAKTVYGATNVTATAATVSSGALLSIVETADMRDISTWLVDTYSPGGKRVQTFVPLGQVTGVDTMTMNHKTILSHKISVKFFPDTTGAYTYIKTTDGVFSA